MTGTSLDGLDVALVRIAGSGLAMRAEVVATHSRPLGELAAGLRELAEQVPMAAGRIAALARDFALLHAEAVRECCRSARRGRGESPDSGSGRPCDLIAVHGQTVYHAPPVSWQLFSPAILAHALRTPVVCDLRAADLAAGGQGAPITPLADWVLFRDERRARAVVNLGGFCNYTWLPASGDGVPSHAVAISAIRGGDVCTCNHLLDAIARTRLGQPFDPDGACAARGTVQPAAFEVLVDALRRQSTAGRSLGTADESLAWAEQHAARLSPEDTARTACAALAQVIIERLPAFDELIVAGGSARNRTLLEELRRRSAAPVAVSDEYGVPATHREAAAMAILGALSQDGVPITLPQITGRDPYATRAGAPIDGTWSLCLANEAATEASDLASQTHETSRMAREFTVIIERDEDGWLIGTVPELRGCHSQARTLDTLMKRVREAAALCLEVEKAGPPTQFVGIQRIAIEE